MVEKAKRAQILNEIRWLIDCPKEDNNGLVRFYGAFYNPRANTISIALEYMDLGCAHSVLAFAACILTDSIAPQVNR